FCRCSLTACRPLSGSGELGFGVALLCRGDTQHAVGQIDVHTSNIDVLWKAKRTEQGGGFEVAQMKDSRFLAMRVFWRTFDEHLIGRCHYLDIGGVNPR